MPTTDSFSQDISAVTMADSRGPFIKASYAEHVCATSPGGSKLGPNKHPCTRQFGLTVFIFNMEDCVHVCHSKTAIAAPATDLA